MNHITKSAIQRYPFRLFTTLAAMFLMTNIMAFTTVELNTASAEKDVFELISSRIKKDIEKSIVLSSVQKNIESFLPEYIADSGSFADVDYNSKVRTNWPPIVHLERIKDLVFAYTMPGNKYYEDEAVYDMIERGMQYWYNKNPNSSNWWYNQVGEPQQVVVILLQMRSGKKKLSDDLEQKTIERLKSDGGNPARQVGANKIDVALHWLYRACLTNDAELLKETLSHAYLPLQYVRGEGIQYDNSYFQHGQQLYIGGYGDELIKGVLLFALYTEGTEFALPDAELQILSKFFRETYLSVIRGQYFLFDVLGRGMSRVNRTFKKGSAAFVEKMKIIDSQAQDQAEYDQALKRLNGEEGASYGISARNRHYFRADYTLHTRPAYAFDVRTVSKRTVRLEMGNGENLKCYFLSDGCTNIAVDGDEYAEIFPVWNWTRIPGVTSPQVAEIPQDKRYGGRGSARFVGGVSDSLYAVATYSYYDKFENVNTGACKSWFMFDEEIVCLGSGINSSSDFEINTTLNQCLKKSEIVISQNGSQRSLSRGLHTFTKNIDWIHHNKVAYFFPSGGEVYVSNMQQKGSWYAINNTQKKGIVEKDVFTLWLDHGKSPQKSKYAYIVVPNKEQLADVKLHPIENIEILLNSYSVQVVRHKALNIWQMVFFKPGTFTHNDLVLTVDRPCALMLKGIGTSKVKLHIADPAQAREKILVRTLIPSLSTKEKETLCDFSQLDEIYAGKTKVYEIDENSADF